MRALVVLLALTGCGLLVTFFWRQQLLGRVEPMPPLVAQLERLVEAGALGGASPEELVATLVFSEPFKEADPWDLAPRRKGGMSAMFGEPRETGFLAALGREPRTAAWRLPAADAAAAAEAEVQMSAALAWAAEKGVRLRVIAHGPSLDPVLRAALAAPPAEPPVVERVLGVGVRLGDIKARDPELAAALDRRAPAGQWLDLFSEASVVPRELGLERVAPGAPPELQELAWPGSSWVPTVVGLAARGAPQAAPAMPAAAPGSQLSVRQFRSVKDGRMTQRVVDGKGNLVSGSLIVPKLDKEEVPPDPEAAQNKVGDPAAAASASAVGRLDIARTGWSLARRVFFRPETPKLLPCATHNNLFNAADFGILVNCTNSAKTSALKPRGCTGSKEAKVNHKGRPATVCIGVAGADKTRELFDDFRIQDGQAEIFVRYHYPSVARRGEHLDKFMEVIEGLEPPAGK